MTAELFKHRKNIIREMIQDEKYVPMRFRDMCFVLGVSGDERDELKEILDSLIEDGLLDMTARGKYIRPENRNVTGFFSGSGRGFGFVRVDQSEEERSLGEEAIAMLKDVTEHLQSGKGKVYVRI